MKVLILSDYSPTWDESPISRLLHLAREISKNGHDVRVVGSYSNRPATIDNIKVLALPYHARGGMAQAVFSLRKEIRQQVRWSDAVIVRGYWLGFWSLLYATVSGVSVRIYDFHGYVCKEQWYDRRIVRSLLTYVLESAGLALSTSVLAVSHGVKDDLPAFIKRKAITVENGVDIDRFKRKQPQQQITALKQRYAISDDKFIFTIVAKFGPWMNMPEVIQAASLLQEHAEIMIIGYGPGIEEAKKWVNLLKTENVIIAGRLPHDDVVAILCHVSDAFLCPYDGHWLHAHEPNYFASRKIKEYLAAGRPIVVSDVNGRGDFLVDGETCLLYTSNNSNALADKMRRLISDSDLAIRIGVKGRQVVEYFTWSAICKKSGLLERLANW